MTVDHALRIVHVAAGFAGLVVGPIVLSAGKRPGVHPLVGNAYFALVTVVCATAAVIGARDWDRLWWFALMAGGTYAIALPGWLAAKRRWRGWLLAHAVGSASSYVALVTAFLVTNVRRVIDLSMAVRLLVPMFVGTCIVAWLAVEVAGGRRPRR